MTNVMKEELLRLGQSICFNCSCMQDRERHSVDTGGGRGGGKQKKDPGIKLTHKPDDSVCCKFSVSNQSSSSLRGTSCLISSNGL